MNHKKNLVLLLVLAFSLSVFGFILDLGERVPNIATNVIEITIMAVLMFGLFCLLYSIAVLAGSIFNKKTSRN